MNNLKLYSEVSLNLQLLSNEELILFSAFDIEQNRLFFASSSNNIYATHLSSIQHERAWSKTPTSAQVHQIELEPEDFITSLGYLMEKEALLLGTSNGLLLLHSVDDNDTQIVGGVDGGVKCFARSPDGDLLAITTGSGQILDWDLLYETAFEDLPEDVNHVCETQFENPISWRGDGKYFVTLSEALDSTSLHKRLKIWERHSGALHAVSEAKSMGSVVDWMPSGAKIAAVYDRKSENECPSIVFFERNGLDRSLFSINEETNATIEFLKWNCSSDLLAAIVSCENYDCVKVWYFSNSHWYLKSEVRYPRQNGVRFVWNPTKPLQLLCWTLRGQITSYDFIWNSAVMDDSTALVIDDSRIFVTPLSLYQMPPPMYIFSLKFPSAVRDLAYYSKNSKYCLAASLSDGGLCVVELPATDSWEELEGKEFSVEASISEPPFGFYCI